MYGLELDYFIRQDVFVMEYFNGIYCSDGLMPTYIKYPSSYIFNVGKHWVVIFIDEHKRGIYFDTFGLPPPTGIHIFLDRTCVQWIYNAQRIQSLKSNDCGKYCLLFLRHLSLKREVIDFINTFQFLDDQEKELIINNKFIRCYGHSKICRIQEIVNKYKVYAFGMENKDLWK